ncbi:hypothetical protein LP418_15415 [Nocardioides sp. B-3]|nr:hypothetical protein [Nocardioides sp. B-3]UUZ57791.1 hypothetical protein LP418_15415 [Nocardioides sp. B-3]
MIAVLGAVPGVVLGIGFGIALMHSLREEGLEVISVPTGQLAIFLVVSVVIGGGRCAAAGPASREAGRPARNRCRMSVLICGRSFTMRFDKTLTRRCDRSYSRACGHRGSEAC